MEDIENLIYLVRDKQVMLDSDVAKLYKYEIKRINETVKRNKRRFPDEFCFQLTTDEYNILKSQFATSRLIDKSRNMTHGGKRKLPFVFTEQGIAMLSGLLKNDIAIEVSINIIRAFVEMRRFVLNNRNLFERVITIENAITNKFIEYNKNFDEIFNYLQKEEFKQKIFYEGQIYDAYTLLLDIILKANENIVIIDNYIDKTVLDLLSRKNNNVNVRIITNHTNRLSDLDIFKFNEQYPRLEVEYNDSYHDRFIIVDNIIYHLGVSLKDLGRKTFAITIMEDMTLLEKVRIS
jgi:hypothetical protein